MGRCIKRGQDHAHSKSRQVLYRDSRKEHVLKSPIPLSLPIFHSQNTNTQKSLPLGSTWGHIQLTQRTNDRIVHMVLVLPGMWEVGVVVSRTHPLRFKRKKSLSSQAVNAPSSRSWQIMHGSCKTDPGRIQSQWSGCLGKPQTAKLTWDNILREGLTIKELRATSYPSIPQLPDTELWGLGLTARYFLTIFLSLLYGI